MKLLPTTLKLAGALAVAFALTATQARAALPFGSVLYAQANTNSPSAEAAEPASPARAADIAADAGARPHRRTHRNEDVLVRLGGDSHVRSNETYQVSVTIGGDGRVDGTLNEVMVVIGGNATVQGEVKGPVVAVGGDVRVLAGANIGGDVISVGGQVEQDPTATIGGHVQQVAIGYGLPDLRWLKDWLVQCVFKLRPLSLGIGWVWLVALAFFLLYLLVAVGLQRPVAACVRQLDERPASTFLAGLLGKLLVPLFVGVLVITGIGVLGIPFLLVAVLVAVLIGKVAVYEYLGLQLGRATGNTALQRPLVTFLTGWAMFTVLCVIPVLGFLVLVVTAMWGFGAAVMATFSRSRQERPPTPPASLQPAPAPYFPPPSPAVPVSGTTDGTPTPFSGSAPADGVSSFAPTSSGTLPPVHPARLPEALSFPRASFWRRMGAGFLDLLLIGIVSGIIDIPMAFLVFSVAYYAGMWAWKQTTIGGIIVGLKVIRLDGQPLTWQVTLVRALAAWLSTVVLFLGFFWIAWDPEQQGWHDRIAGTVVVKLPRGTPLLLL